MKKRLLLWLACFSLPAWADDSAAPLLDKCRAVAGGTAVGFEFPDPTAGGLYEEQNIAATRTLIKACLAYLSELKTLREQVLLTERAPLAGGEPGGDSAEIIAALGVLEAEQAHLSERLLQQESELRHLRHQQGAGNGDGVEAVEGVPPVRADGLAAGDGMIGSLRAGGRVIYLLRLQGEAVSLMAGEAYRGQLFTVINGTAFWGEHALLPAEPLTPEHMGAPVEGF